MQQTLSRKVRQHPNITLLERHIAIDLITGAKLGLKTQRCWGAYVLDLDSERTLTLSAPNTVIASGGAGKFYLLHHQPRHRDG